MTEESRSPRVIGAFEPAHLGKDLVIIIFWLIAAVTCIYLPYVNQTFLRVFFVIPVILFIPGYVLIAALFPGREEVTGIERLALSVGLSMAITPLIGFILNYTSSGIRLDRIVISLVIFTAVMILIAQYRRSFLDPATRFAVPFRQVFSRVRDGLFETGQNPGRDRILAVFLIIAMVAVVVTTIFVIVVPREGKEFTEFYLLGPEGKASDYPLRFQVGDEQSLIIGIGNHESHTITYTVETILLNQKFDSKTNTSIISAYLPLDSFTVTIGHDEILEVPYNFTVNDRRYNRLQLLLFNETVPGEDTTGIARVNSSYRDLHLWITVNPKITSSLF